MPQLCLANVIKIILLSDDK